MIRRPLVLISGRTQELPVADSLPGGGAAGDIAFSRNSPTTDETIPSGQSAIVLRKYAIASGTKLTIQSGARFRIL